MVDISGSSSDGVQGVSEDEDEIVKRICGPGNTSFRAQTGVDAVEIITSVGGATEDGVNRNHVC